MAELYDEDDPRYARRIVVTEAKRDERKPWERDRDRLIFCSALKRLAAVTQVVGPVEGHLFHNRLTHTLKVAQIARRLAEKLNRDQPTSAFMNPDCVEAAALAHDIGHPPFGHAAEKELDRLAVLAGDPEGFEANAQSFRLLVTNSAHGLLRNESGEMVPYRGLNLTRATMNAVMKYPWPRSTDKSHKHSRKFSCYSTEKPVFDWVRESSPTDRPSLEAAIMDHADDIAYSIHDLEDFTRAGLIPISRLRSKTDERDEFIEAWKEDPNKKLSADEVDEASNLLPQMLEWFEDHYSGTFEQRAWLRQNTSWLISEFINAISVPDANNEHGGLEMQPAKRLHMRILQRLVWHYVTTGPRVGTVQEGQRRLIRTLFDIYYDVVKLGQFDVVPRFFHETLHTLGRYCSGDDEAPYIRLTVDIIAAFTDAEAINMYRKLAGGSPGSITELIYV